MKQRCLTGTIIGIVFLVLLLLSGTWLFNIVMALLSMIAGFEILNCTNQFDNKLLSIPSLVVCALIPFVARLPYGFIAVVCVVFMFWCFFVSVFTNDRIDTQAISLVFCCIMYVSVCFYSLTRIRYIPDYGFLVLIMVFIGAWATDIFAYFTGRFLGRHKLIPKISPKKTIEGAVGGVVFCILAYMVVGLVAGLILKRVPNYFVIAAMGIVVSVVAQLGDLAMSAVKRNYKMKDFGGIFPGHGGVLDRFDSILAISPFLLMVAGNPGVIDIFKM